MLLYILNRTGVEVKKKTLFVSSNIEKKIKSSLFLISFVAITTFIFQLFQFCIQRNKKFQNFVNITKEAFIYIGLTYVMVTL